MVEDLAFAKSDRVTVFTIGPPSPGAESMQTHRRQLGVWSKTAGLLFLYAAVCRAEEPVPLQETFPAGYQYHVSCRVELSGTLSLPPDKGPAPTKNLPRPGPTPLQAHRPIL